MEVNSFRMLLIHDTFYLLSCLKGSTHCGSQKMKKKRIYSVPAVKGLNERDNSAAQGLRWLKHVCSINKGGDSQCMNLYRI